MLAQGPPMISVTLGSLTADVVRAASLRAQGNSSVCKGPGARRGSRQARTAHKAADPWPGSTRGATRDTQQKSKVRGDTQRPRDGCGEKRCILFHQWHHPALLSPLPPPPPWPVPSTDAQRSSTLGSSLPWGPKRGRPEPHTS